MECDAVAFRVLHGDLWWCELLTVVQCKFQYTMTISRNNQLLLLGL